RMAGAAARGDPPTTPRRESGSVRPELTLSKERPSWLGCMASRTGSAAGDGSMRQSPEGSTVRRITSSFRGQLKGVSPAELAWIGANESLEIALTFACLKVLTRFLGPAMFGEYNLGLTVNVLLAAVTLVPVQQAYLRYFHQAKRHSQTWQVTRQVLRWYAGVTIVVVLAGLFVSAPVAQLFSIGPWTCFALGLAFAGDRWRLLGIQILNIQRRRRAWVVQHVSFLVAQLAFLTLVLWFWPDSASAGLLAYAGASTALAVLSIRNVWRLRERAP